MGNSAKLAGRCRATRAQKTPSTPLRNCCREESFHPPLSRWPAVKSLPNTAMFGAIITGTNEFWSSIILALARSRFRPSYREERMEAYRIERFGSVDGIVLRSSEDPRLGLKEVLMRVRASSLNYRDLMVLKGGGRGPTKIGVVPLSDGAGEVAAIGEGVTRVKIDDRIAGCFHPRWFGGPIKPDYLTDRLGANLDGVLAEYAVFNEEAVVLLPSHLSFEEAVTLPCAAVTAWVALTGHRRVTAGDTVLTQGSGGVAVFAV
jgi:Alcohol dehydrogenase GroES-like domain